MSDKKSVYLVFQPRDGEFYPHDAPTIECVGCFSTEHLAHVFIESGLRIGEEFTEGSPKEVKVDERLVFDPNYVAVASSVIDGAENVVFYGGINDEFDGCMTILSRPPFYGKLAFKGCVKFSQDVELMKQEAIDKFYKAKAEREGAV